MTIDNRALLAGLFEGDAVHVERGSLFDAAPPSLAPRHLADRVEGMLLGLAIGDALGRSTEGMTPGSRAQAHGEVRDYLPSRYAEDRRVGVPSDDTQLAFWTVEHLLEHDGLVPEALLDLFAEREIYGIGQTMLRAMLARRRGVHWTETGQPSAGNGALMRIAPILLPHLPDPSPALWSDVVLASVITHDDPASTAACLAFVDMLWRLLGRSAPPEAAWWVDTFCGTMAPLEGDDTGYVSRSPRIGYEGPVWRFAEMAVRDAEEKAIETARACDTWYSGAYLLETLPSVLLILTRHGDDPEEAIVRAVNDTKDNDTVAAIVGAAVGALHGRSALPERWIEGLLGRTTADDDGRAFELMERALDRWVGESATPPSATDDA